MEVGAVDKEWCFCSPLSLCSLRLTAWSLTGTFVSAFTVLCGARTDLPDRHVCCVFWLNIAAALIQILTAIVMVGWIMSIFWGMDMVILAISQGYKEQGIPQQL
ncbi:protein stum homolog [Fukomys damarensis]|uniref:protein stum homolog n=1 Tax=Fukomys damarensis TaxID=885580 RepID=UPI00145510C1|nr:protein stum homolog [Fukomys damarensis]